MVGEGEFRSAVHSISGGPSVKHADVCCHAEVVNRVDSNVKAAVSSILHAFPPATRSTAL